MQSPIGILPINKPEGMTSHDVVYSVRRIINPKDTPKPERIKIGHTGTLDPFATGVLLITIGKATRLESFFHDRSKEYEATVQLGTSTTTDDLEGEILEEASISTLPKDLEKQLQTNFTGTIQQVPPAFAAIKVDGKKMYNLAREGKQPKQKPREVTIQKLEVTNTTEDTIDIQVTCGTGTYIRSLGRDIGELLKTKAHLTKLTRMRIGDMTLKDSIDLHHLTEKNIAEKIIPITGELLNIPEHIVSETEKEDLLHGRQIQVQIESSPVLCIDEERHPIAICEKREENIQPNLVLASQENT